MKRMSSYRKNLMLKKLSSFNITIITILHIVLPILSVCIGYAIATRQIIENLGTHNQEQIYLKIILLCVILSVIVLGTIDAIFVVNPIISLENIVDEYGRLVDIEDMNANDNYFTTSSLENMFLDMLNDQKQTIKRQYQAEIVRQETELVALQSQINPHFLYNTLDSIRGLALLKDVPEIADTTEALSNLFRNMIAREGQMITVEEEFENINNYMKIQQFRFNNKFDFSKDVSDELSKECLVPNLTLQPLVENAIMHGLEKKRTGGKIIIKAYRTQKRLVLSVSDDGVGIDEKKLTYLNKRLNDGITKQIETSTPYHTGIALININQRIKLQFGNNYGITIMSTPDIYTNVEISLPVIKKEELVKNEKGNSKNGIYSEF